MKLIQFGLQLEDEPNIWDVIDYKLHIEDWFVPHRNETEWLFALICDIPLTRHTHIIFEEEVITCN